MKKILLIIIIALSSCAAPDAKYLIREFNDNGDLIKETVTEKYSIRGEVLKVNGVEIKDNFEIRKLD